MAPALIGGQSGTSSGTKPKHARSATRRSHAGPRVEAGADLSPARIAVRNSFATSDGNHLVVFMIPSRRRSADFGPHL